MVATQSLLVLLTAAVVAGSAAGQPGPAVLRSASLDWPTLRIIIAPDSEGTLLWASSSSGTARNPGKVFSGSFVPTELAGWDAEAREFLKAPLGEADAGESRTSTYVNTTEGGHLYLFRRRLNNSWTTERFLVMQRSDTADPLSVNGNEESIGEILDSLLAVNKRTPVLPYYPRSTDSARIFDKHAAAKRTNKPPPYPRDALHRGIEGLVVLAFMVSADGKADLSTVVIEYSTAEGFTDTVLRQLGNFSFEAARRGGAPVRERVVMPFVFSLSHGRSPR